MTRTDHGHSGRNGTSWPHSDEAVPEVPVNPSTVPPRTADRLAWQAYADACCEHDRPHAQRACEELRSVDVPSPRTAEDR